MARRIWWEPLARVNLLHEQVPAHLLALLAGSAVQFPSRNMFHAIAGGTGDPQLRPVHILRHPLYTPEGKLWVNAM